MNPYQVACWALSWIAGFFFGLALVRFALLRDQRFRDRVRLFLNKIDFPNGDWPDDIEEDQE